MGTSSIAAEHPAVIQLCTLPFCVYSLHTLTHTGAILRAAVAGVLLVTSLDVLAGHTTVGDWVAMQQYVQNLFQPLSWLGTMYGEGGGGV